MSEKYGISYELNFPVNINGEDKVERLERKIVELTSDYEACVRVIERLQSELDDAKAGRGIDVMEEKIRKLERTIMKSDEEFRTFLNNINLNNADIRSHPEVIKLFDDIHNGSITAGEAMGKFKEKFAHLMEESYSAKGGGILDPAQAGKILTMLTDIQTSISGLRDDIIRLKADAGMDDVVGDLGTVNKEITGIAEGAERMDRNTFFRAMVDSINEIKPAILGIAGAGRMLLDLLNEINKSAAAVAAKDFSASLDLSGIFKSNNKEEVEAYKRSVREYVSVIQSAYDEFARLNSSGAIRNTAGLNLSKYSKELYAFGQDFGKLKSQLNITNSFTNLDKIAQDAQLYAKSLQPVFELLNQAGLTDIDMDKLFAPPERAASTVEQVKDSMLSLTDIKKQLSELGDAGTTEITVKAVEQEGKVLETLNELYNLHKNAVEKAVEAEAEKTRISQELADKLSTESVVVRNTADATKEAAKEEVAALEDVNEALVPTNAGGNEQITETLAQRKSKIDEMGESYQSYLEVIEEVARSEARKAAEASTVTESMNNQALAVRDVAQATREQNAAAESGSVTMRKKAEAAEREAEAEWKVVEAAEMSSKAAAEKSRAEQMEANAIDGEFRVVEERVALEGRRRLALEASAEAEKKAAEASAQRHEHESIINEDFERAVEDMEKSADAQEKLNEARRNTSDATDEAEASERQYDRALKQVEDTLKGVKSELHDLEHREGGTELQAYEELLEMEERLQELKETGRDMNYDDLLDDIASLQLGLSRAKEELLEYKNAMKDADKEARDSDRDTARRARALEEISRALGRCEEAERKYYLAGHTSRNKEDYETILRTRDALKQLEQELLNSEGATVEQASAVRELRAEFERAENNIKDSGGALQRWWSNGLTELGQRITYAIGLVDVIEGAMREIEKMVSVAVELDSALNQLQIVTRASGDEMKQYASQIAQTAKETAQSTKDLIGSTTVFARLGYSMDESAVLSKYSAMLQGVGDIEAQAAQDAMTAIIKAFDLQVDDIEDVMNKMVVVGNNFPISVSQIAEGMNNAGSMLAVAGNSLEESIALLTAANTTVQNISKASTGLRTITARIRKTVSEEEDGEIINEAKYEEMLNILTMHKVTLTDINGEYRSTYDIIRDIAGVWDELGSMDQAAVTEALAGTRQQNIFSSLITQFKEAEDAVDRMKESGGELEEAYDIYLNSIEAHVNQLKAAFDKLSMDFVDSDLAKNAVDAVTKIIDVLDKLIEKIGAAETVALALGVLVGPRLLAKLFMDGGITGAILTISKFFIETLPGALTALGGAMPVIAGIASVALSVAAVANEIKTVQNAGLIGKGHDAEEYAENVENLRKRIEELTEERERLAESGADLTMIDNELTHAQIALKNATDEQTAAMEDEAEAINAVKEALQNMQRGGNVNLLNRPVISARKLANAGWEDVGEGGATVYTNTYSNEDETIAMNFTPIIVDEDGNFIGVLSPGELANYAQDVIDGVHDDYLNLKIGTTFTGERAVQYAEAAAERIHELHEKLFSDDLDKMSLFDEKIKDLSDKTLKKLLRAENLSQRESEEFAYWLQKSGFTADEAAEYFLDYADDIRKAAEAQKKLVSEKELGDLTSLQDELAATTAALDKYKQAMEGGEMGDAVKEMAEIYKGAVEDLKSGRIDSNRVRAAAEMFFSQEQLAAMHYDMREIGKALQSDLFMTLFDPEGESKQSAGQRFAKYIGDNTEKFAKAGASLTKTADGGYQFYYDSLKKLAEAFGMSEAACTAFLDDLDAYGVEVMRSTEENNELIRKFREIPDSIGDAQHKVAEFIRQLHDAGRDSIQIQTILQDLRKAGVINLNEDEINNILGNMMKHFDEVDKTKVNPEIDLETSGAYADAAALKNYLIKLFSGAITQTIHLDYQGNVSTRAGSGAKGGGGGAARASGGRASGKTLVNELGPELISDNGKAYIANNGEPGFVNLTKDAIVFNAEETQKIMHGRMFVGRANAMATGTPKTVMRNGKSVWICPNCGKEVAASNNYCSCGYYRYGGSNQNLKSNTATSTTKAVATNTAGRWTCNHCGFANPQTAVKCQNCGNVRGSIPERVTTSSYTTKVPEQTITLGGGTYWKCDNCGRTNSTSVNYCASCGKYRFSTSYTEIPGNPSTGWKANQGVNFDSLFSFGDDGSAGGGTGGSSAAESKSNPQKIDWIAVKLNRIQRSVADLEKVASSGLKRLTTRIDAAKDEASKLNEEIDIAQRGYDRYIQEANSVGLSEDIASKVRNGAIDIDEYEDEELRQQISEYKEWYEKALDCKSAVEDLHQSIGKLYKDMFDNTQADFENQLAEIEHSANMTQKNIDMAAAKGYLDSAKFYEQLADTQTVTANKLRAELADLNVRFKEAMDSGEIEEFSEEWYAMKQSINDVEEAIADANIQLVEYQKQIRQINWSYFDYAAERFGKINEEAEFFISLMSNHKLFEENGQFNKLGEATVGMHAVRYNAFMAEADEYAKEITKVQHDLEQDPYDTELIARREELVGLQQQSILAAEGEKNAIKDLVQQGINLELTSLRDLIDTYKESIDSAKDLYEYQKKISNKTSDIASIQKQLAAYQGDDSEETRAKVQKLNNSLQDKQRDLQETERDQSISDQKKLLDDLYSDYEELINKRLDDIDSLMQEMIVCTNQNMDSIRNTLLSVGSEVGYNISDRLAQSLKGELGYYDHAFDGLTSIHGVLTDIYNMVNAMARASGAVKAYKVGGLVDYTGLAAVHGKPSKPEMVLSAKDTENFLAAAEMLRQEAIKPSSLRLNGNYGMNGMEIGSINVSIPIERVQDYNDFVSQLRNDPKFERLISTITLDRAVGKSTFRKNQIRF